MKKNSSPLRAPDGDRAVINALPDLAVVLDFEPALPELERLRVQGVTDLAAHFHREPAHRIAAARLIRTLDANPPGLAAAGVSTREQLQATLTGAGLPEPYPVLLTLVLLAAWDRSPSAERAHSYVDAHGRRRECLLRCSTLSADSAPAGTVMLGTAVSLDAARDLITAHVEDRDLQAEIFARANVLVWRARVRRENGRFIWHFRLPSNSLASRLYQLTRSTERGDLWNPASVPDLPAMEQRSADAMLSGAPGYQQEFRVLVGERTHWIAEDVTIARVDPEEWSLVGVVSDVTARHEAEEAYRRSAAHQRNLLERADCMFWQARVTAVGDTFQWAMEVPPSGLQRRLFGGRGAFTYAGATGHDGGRLFGEHEVPEAREKDARGVDALRRGAPGYENEFRVVTPQQTYWLQEQVTITPVGPGVFDLVGVTFDITARRAAEEESRRSSAHMRQLLERADCMLWQARVRREDGQFRWAFDLLGSGLQSRLFGDRTPQRRSGITIRDVPSIYGGYPVLDQAEMDARSETAFRDGRTGYEQEFRVQAPDQVLWLHEQVSITPVGPDQWDLVGVVFDVTPRREAELARRRSEAQVREILERAECMVWLAHVRHTAGAWDWRFDVPASVLRRRLWGAADQGGDAVGVTGRNLYGGDEIPERAEMNERGHGALQAGAGSYQNQFRVITAGGTVWLQEQVSITRVGPDQWQLVGVTLDITARREAELARRATEQRLQQLLARADCMIWEASVRLDENGEFRWSFYTPSSQLYRQLFGRDPGPTQPRMWGEVVVPEIGEMHARSRRAMRSGVPGYTQEFRVVAPRQTYWLREQVSIAVHPAGHWELTGVVTDITARRAAETALAAEKERLAVTLRAMSEGVVTTDLHGRVQFLNRAAAALLGCDENAAVGRRLGEVCVFSHAASGAVWPLPLDNVLQDGAQLDLPAQTVLNQPGGRSCLVAGRCVPVRDTASAIIGAVLVLDDITERQRLDEHLQRASKLESIGILAGGIAHDFNNILTAIMGNLSLALLDAREDSPTHQNLSDAQAATLRARDLTQQLLTFAKGGDPVRTAVRLPELITEVARFALHGSSVGCDFALPPDLWSADADRGQFSQIVQNLVINAVQAMAGGGLLRIAAGNESVPPGGRPPLAPGDFVHLTVADTGSGISAENLPRIFDPYFTTKQHGHGLGLATVYSIVRRHGGHIEVQSEPGRGTTFHLWLPAVPDPGAPAGAVDGAVRGPLRGRVLFMDDEAPIRKLGATLLTRLGLDVELASDGAEAVRNYRQARDAGRPFDVVVMDLTVPGGMGGREALAELRALDPQVRAIVSSGYSSDPVLANHRAFGFCGVVAKPYQVEHFARVLREALAAPRT